VIRNYLKRHLGPARAAYRRARAAIPAPRSATDLDLHSSWLQAFDFKTILDVGANEGTFARIARSAFPDAQIYSYEPLPNCARVIEHEFANDERFELFRCALGRHHGESRMFHNEYSASSSILAMAKEHVEAFPYTARTSQITVPIRTMDETLEGKDLAGPTLLKLDVQGYELRVLAGAPRTLAKAHVLLVELSVQRLYEDAPLFDEVYQALRAHGFALSGVIDVLRRPADNRPLQIDAVFERV
jgi:FkbM family methyltransferase